MNLAKSTRVGQIPKKSSEMEVFDSYGNWLFAFPFAHRPVTAAVGAAVGEPLNSNLLRFTCRRVHSFSF